MAHFRYYHGNLSVSTGSISKLVVTGEECQLEVGRGHLVLEGSVRVGRCTIAQLINHLVLLPRSEGPQVLKESGPLVCRLERIDRMRDVHVEVHSEGGGHTNDL